MFAEVLSGDPVEVITPCEAEVFAQSAGPGWLRTSSAILLSKAVWSPVHRLQVPALLIFRLSDVKPN